MRLTNTIRQAFVKAALDDVPSVNYQDQMYKLALKDAVDQLPPDVVKAYKAHPQYFNVSGRYHDGVGHYGGPWGDNRMRPETVKQIQDLHELNQAQRDHRRQLEIKLRGVADSTNTRKALVEALPEFEKYLPVEDLPLSRQVPALANVLSDFVKAGWPKKNVGKIAKATAALA
jgi:hypothetical protein